MKNSEVKPGTRFQLPYGTVCVVLSEAITNNPLKNKWWVAPVDDNSKPAFLMCFDVDEQAVQAKEPAAV